MSFVQAEIDPASKRGKSQINVAGRLSKLRAEMETEGVQAYLIPSADPHNNEYVPGCWKRREFISGFTGSAGDVVVAVSEGGLWTDGRYFIQADEQLRDTGLTLHKIGEKSTCKIEDWVADQCAEGGALGVDPQLISVEVASKFEKALSERGGSIKFIDRNLVDAVWEDQPERGFSPLDIVPDSVAGKSVLEKLELVRKKLAEKQCSVHLVSSLDAVAWLFNLRGSDIDYNRVFVAYAAVTTDGACLFIEPERITPEIKNHLGESVEIQPYDGVVTFLKNLAGSSDRLWLDPKQTSKWLEVQVDESVKVHKERSPITDLKGVKNEVELAGFRECHLTDGVAMVKFLKWLEENVPAGGVSECSAAAKLETFRKQGEGFLGCSFPTIAGYNDHGAIIHYEASPETEHELKPEGIFLLDSGGHYRTGTTDITRTLALGKPTAEQKDVFTRVLKGVIGLTDLKFPKGFNGKQLELPARMALWDSGRNFNHGTGHGVGHSLNVHEGPVYFSPKAAEVPLEVGHVLSNEPGFYKTGEFGVRIENLMVVQNAEDLSSPEIEFLGFETITFCPIDLRLIAPELLSQQEIQWLNNYHQEVYDQLSPLLEEEEKIWLQQATRQI